MTRASRLLDLLQILRRHRRPVAAMRLADELGVSLRTVYRDIETLKAGGAGIEGEAGLGYVLRDGTFLPPLMFGEDEADAVLLGLRLVMARTDEAMAAAAGEALAKIESVLPEPLREISATSGLAAPRLGAREAPHLAAIRRAIRAEERLGLAYVDAKGVASERVVWPVAVGFFQASEVLAAWCETRGDFRSFRLDRIRSAASTQTRMPRRHRILLAEWRRRIENEDDC